jgi:AcrR family transcriptional regulator
MARLLKRRSREEARHIARERRRSLLEAAAHCFGHLPYPEVTLEAIGKRAGVAQGIAAMYYESKEDLFLLVLRDSLGPWFDAYIGKVDASDEPLEPGALAHLVSRELAREDALVRLLGLLPVVAEQNLDLMAALDFLGWLRERTEALGATLERRCPALDPGGGARLLLRLYCLLAGIPRIEGFSANFGAALRETIPEVADADYSEVFLSLAAGVLPGSGTDRT